MNTKLKIFKIGVQVAAIASLTLGSIACSDSTAQSQQATSLTYPNVAPTNYGIASLKIINDYQGKAIIKLDNYTLSIDFSYLAHSDSYGVVGTEYTAIEITNIEVRTLIDENGNSTGDFTDYNDILNIKQLIVAHIEKNKLVEVQS